MHTLNEPVNDTADNEVAPWALPVRYNELSPIEQAKALRAAVLAYLQARGSAAKSILVKELAVPRADTLQKALDYLSATQQIYLDATSGSRDRIYHSNGRLAHPGAERIVDCGKIQYVIRSYNDRWAGQALTITQYAVQPSGERNPVGGIRVDWRDVEALAPALRESKTALGVVVSGQFAAKQPQLKDDLGGR